MAEFALPDRRSFPATTTRAHGEGRVTYVADGRRVHVLHNCSWEPARAEAPVELTDVLAGGSLPARARVELGAWDVRVFVAVPTE
jgi:beta-galactosidase